MRASSCEEAGLGLEFSKRWSAVKWPLTSLWLLGGDTTKFRVGVAATGISMGAGGNWLAYCWLGEYLRGHQ